MTGGTYKSIAVSAYAGTRTDSSVFYAQNGATFTGGMIQPGVVTPAETGDLLVTVTTSGEDQDASTSSTINSGFTLTDNAYDGTSMPAAMAYLVANNTSAVNPTWSGKTQGSTAIAVFRPEVSGASTWSSTLVATEGGNVGIGTTAPAAKLAVEGNATVSGSAAVVGNVSVGGNVAVAAASQVGLEGASGDSYFRYDPDTHETLMYVDGELVARFAP
jgi:hypothetical protein